MNKADFWLKSDPISMARSKRLSTVQASYDAGNLTKAEAKVILAGSLTPGHADTIYNDSEYLESGQVCIDSHPRACI
jgi:hypothetical protein